MELPGPNWDVSIYLYTYFVSNEKKIKKAFCNTGAVQQSLALGNMYSVYTTIKLGMFHSIFLQHESKHYDFFYTRCAHNLF